MQLSGKNPYVSPLLYNAGNRCPSFNTPSYVSGSQQIVGWKSEVVDTLDKNNNYVGSHGSIDCHGIL